MDKLVYDERGSATISNDGATIMKLLDIVHPAAKTLVEIAKSQDAEVEFLCTYRNILSWTIIYLVFQLLVKVGDGTTSVVVLAGELLKQSKEFVEDGVPPIIIIRGLRKACELVSEILSNSNGKIH